MFDKFLKMLKTDRNTFVSYILSLFTIYILVDRTIEMILMVIRGYSSSYWGPFAYTFALLIPILGYLFIVPSAFAKTSTRKLRFFYVYCVILYIITVSMATQWINRILWIGLVSVPNFSIIAREFPEVITPAFSAISAFIPIMTFYRLVMWLIFRVNDNNESKKGIIQYDGVSLSVTKKVTGPYTCEIFLCKDTYTGKSIYTPENKRYESTLITGGTGTGKTTLMLEPMIAMDIEKKYFFREAAKQAGFNALTNGIATLRVPYNNKYLNEHFSLTMLVPHSDKITTYKNYIRNLLCGTDLDGNFIYKTLGLTTIAQDSESVKIIRDIANNYNIPINVVDPEDPDSMGINPFIISNPSQIGVVISEAIQEMTEADFRDNEYNTTLSVTQQVIENLAILLKIAYPMAHDGKLPTLGDMLNIFNDFTLAENLCEILKASSEASTYKTQIAYFEKNFYRPREYAENPSMGVGIEETQKLVYPVIAQLDNLLRNPGIRRVLCNRDNNIDFDRAIAEGEITAVCAKRGDLGFADTRFFGMFFILSFQNAILRRPGTEETRIPHFLYIDEFANYICKQTEAMFTLFRKYRCGVIVTIQNLAQLEKKSVATKYRELVLSNTKTKIVFGNTIQEDSDYWAREIGEKEKWEQQFDYTPGKEDEPPVYKNWKLSPKPLYKSFKVTQLPFKMILYKTKNVKGGDVAGMGTTEFIAEKHKQPHISKSFDFTLFTGKTFEDEDSGRDDNISEDEVVVKSDRKKYSN